MQAEINKGKCHGADGWFLNNGEIELFLTKQGGQHAPVTFFINGKKPIQPYFLNPWQDTNPQEPLIPLLDYLRGDFFCLPFGGNGDAVNGVQFQCHGDTSSNDWSQGGMTSENGKVAFHFYLDGKNLPYHVEKCIEMHQNQSALYLSHTVSNLTGKMPYGHHTILQMPAPQEKMYFSCGKFDLGMTPTSLFSDPANWEYQYLASGAEFDDLKALPTRFKDPATADYSLYPSPIGYTDLFALLKKPTAEPAWATAVYADSGYLYYSLKNAAELPSTTIWTANSGRYEYPWNGITRCFAIEETCSYFADGWKPSIEENALTQKGWKTCGEFLAEKPTVIRNIQGVLPIPTNLKKIASAKFQPGTVTFTDENGIEVTASVDWEFLL